MFFENLKLVSQTRRKTLAQSIGFVDCNWLNLVALLNGSDSKKLRPLLRQLCTGDYRLDSNWTHFALSIIGRVQGIVFEFFENCLNFIQSYWNFKVMNFF